MPLPPSRRDSAGPPPRKNVSDLSALVRHHQSYLRGMDPGFLDGRFATPQPVADENSQLVGEDTGGGDTGADEILFINTDQYVIPAAGDATFALTYLPLDGSLHVRWVPLHVPVDNWTLSDNILTVTDPGWRADDLIEVAYAYEYDGEPEPSSIVPGADFASDTGWKWLQVPFHDPGDYSDPAFDDSAWADGDAPFGETNPPNDVAEVFDPYPWPDYSTVWNQNTQMWARRGVDVDPGIPVTVSIRLNRTALLWWNGDYRGKTTATEHTWEIPADLVEATNVAVFKVSDDSFSGHLTGCYFDAQISQVIEESA